MLRTGTSAEKCAASSVCIKEEGGSLWLDGDRELPEEAVSRSGCLSNVRESLQGAPAGGRSSGRRGAVVVAQRERIRVVRTAAHAGSQSSSPRTSSSEPRSSIYSEEFSESSENGAAVPPTRGSGGQGRHKRSRVADASEMHARLRHTRQRRDA
eukprot:jgi/Ulvmu1/4018/UM188_0008.1